MAHQGEPYALCETYSQPPSVPWHIRKLGEDGLKLGGIVGGALSLCGATIAWDLAVALTEHHISHACSVCAAKYQKGER